ncbi:hypothetical protein P152DRAFT_483208 [Eremomyces bilateralis CBS 781.70]|uniref:Glutaredoxin domain-containing protein n=1 Tax=Eremomyces bilateralis CBS 781.70 TaxID=1392243 RepID=A0A6G1G073_9PEZI|nr:uncharacterized protein P152DRAFT_483208 [Eremomyces bilateralis CBS 781.70]KAF1811326.1 hypothetical protein P152DRAFT_483208 [Eremomyces bilateralis CBS 781.70]
MGDLLPWESSPHLYLFSSLTAGSSHILTATSRVETILKANRIPYTYVDTATNDSARKLYGRRGKNKKFPLLVKEGFVLGDLEEVEEWNEFGELKEMVGELPAKSALPGEDVDDAGSVTAGGAAAGAETKAPSQVKEEKITKPESNVPSAMKESVFAAAALAAAKTAPAQSPMTATAPETKKATEKALDSGALPLTAEKEPTQPDTSASSSKPEPMTGPPITPASPRPIDTRAPDQSTSNLGSTVVSPTGSQTTLPYRPPTHRGSEVSVASEEEVRAVEEKTVILEEGGEREKEESEESEEESEEEEEEKEEKGERVKDKKDAEIEEKRAKVKDEEEDDEDEDDEEEDEDSEEEDEGEDEDSEEENRAQAQQQGLEAKGEEVKKEDKADKDEKKETKPEKGLETAAETKPAEAAKSVKSSGD